MTAVELKKQLDDQVDLQVVDLREPYEHEDGFISEINIPLAEVMSRVNELNTDKNIVLYCNSGKRSKSMIFMLQKQHGLNNISHLEGGYQAWLEQVEFA
ncbi:MAG: rhodanese-like domain-containing protein [Rhodobacteraceae bacterium]|nr:rhodanese-like domain-containing protein [Paracoccaceae bacterium]